MGRRTLGGRAAGQGQQHRWAFKAEPLRPCAPRTGTPRTTAHQRQPHRVDNPGRFDKVNIYGDEDVTVNNGYRSISDLRDYPGLGIPAGQLPEVDLVDYGRTT